MPKRVQPRFKLFSRALLCTCVVDISNKIVFDAGGALPFIVSPRYEEIFVTHCDPDHISGLFPYALLKGNEKVKVYAPKSCADIIKRHSKELDLENVEIRAVKDGDEITISKGKKIVVLGVKHLHKDAVAFLLKRKTRKLLSEYVGLTSQEISNLVKKGIHVTKEEWANDVIYTGDIDKESLEKLPEAEFLITETTYPNDMRERAQQYGHVCEQDVDAVATKYSHVIKIHESIGFFDKPHENKYVERIDLGKYKG